MFINTMRVTAGELEGFRRSIESAVEFVEVNGPQLMVEIYVDEAQMRAYSFQLYPDSESIRAHWRMSDPYIREVMKHATVERLDVYGRPDEAVTEGIRAFSEGGVEVSVTPNFTGFNRLGKAL